MKKIKFLSMLMLAVMVLPLMVSCSNDDKGNSKRIDDVNVVNGKKIVELSFSSEKENGLPDVYTIGYDNKGRLSNISYRYRWNRYDSLSQKYVSDSMYMEIANIDYNSRTVNIPYEISIGYHNNRSQVDTFSFSLNDDGYISQVGGCKLTYDQYGYLKTVEEIRSVGTIEYNTEDFIKASISRITGTISLIYVPYSNMDDKGDLYIRVRQSDDERRSHEIDERDIVVFIAYQAGLLGKVTKTVMNIKGYDEGDVMYEYEATKWPRSGVITYVCK